MQIDYDARLIVGSLISVGVQVGGERLDIFEFRKKYFIEGPEKVQYTIVVYNRTKGRLEVVAAADRQDVTNGGPAGYQHKGLIVGAGDSLVIAGKQFLSFARTTLGERIGSPLRDIGAIGIAVYPEYTYTGNFAKPLGRLGVPGRERGVHKSVGHDFGRLSMNSQPFEIVEIQYRSPGFFEQHSTEFYPVVGLCLFRA